MNCSSSAATSSPCHTEEAAQWGAIGAQCRCLCLALREIQYDCEREVCRDFGYLARGTQVNGRKNRKFPLECHTTPIVSMFFVFRVFISLLIREYAALEKTPMYF